MVKSGLVDDPRVSQYRLTAHLSLALAIYSAMLWTALSLAPSPPRVHADRTVRRLGWAIAITVAYMIVTGGFVAGIRAGYAYNSFPFMNGHIIPPEIMMVEPWYLNFFTNMATVQFDHRLGAWLLAVLTPWLWLRARREQIGAQVRRALNLLLAAVTVQIALGIATLLAAVPVALGAAHQAGAVLVLTATLYACHTLRTPARRRGAHRLTAQSM
jgi:cytochrome c oxidase assembly protein subunit 15